MRRLMIPVVALVTAAVGRVRTACRHTRSRKRRARGRADDVHPVLWHWTLVPVRPGSKPNLAVAAIRRQQLHRHRRLRGSRCSRPDDSTSDGRARSRSSHAGPTTPRSVRQRHDCLEHGGARGRAAGRRTRAAAAARRRRRTSHGDLGRRRMASSRPRRRTTRRRSLLKAAPRCPSQPGRTVTSERSTSRTRSRSSGRGLTIPVLGDTEVQFNYTDYKDFNGVRFPSRIVRVQGGHPCSTSRSRRSPPIPA